MINNFSNSLITYTQWTHNQSYSYLIPPYPCPILHYVKSARIQSFSGPYFPAFGLNTEIYSDLLNTEM